MFLRSRPEIENKLAGEAISNILNCKTQNLPHEYHMDTFRGGRYASYFTSFAICTRTLDNGDPYKNCHKFLSMCNKINVTCANTIHELNTCMKKTECEESQKTKDFMDNYLCLEKLMTDERRSCVSTFESWCTRSRLRSVKTIRMSMEHVQHMMEVDPQIKVIHLLRDPRAILRSQSNLMKKLRDEWEKLAVRLCSRLVKDVSIRETLEQKYPGQLMQIRYEDLATNPIKSAETMYKYLSLPLPKQVSDWIEQSTNADTNNGARGTKRENSTKVAYAWQEELTDEQKQTFLDLPECARFLNKLKYD